MLKELWVIERGKVHKISINETSKKASEIKSNPLRIGYDIHLGFNFPDNSGFRMLCENINKPVIVEPIAIDEREQSGRVPFSPTQVYVEVGGKVLRRRVANSRSTFLSQLECDVDKIREIYRELSFREAEILAKKIGPEKSLGEFLVAMHYAILRQQLNDLDNVSVSEPRYDRYNCKSGETSHSPTCHITHDLLYIPLHKGKLEQIINTFETARTAGLLSQEPKFIILPIELPRTYFKKH